MGDHGNYGKLANWQKAWDFLNQDISKISLDLEAAAGTGKDIYDAVKDLGDFITDDDGKNFPVLADCPLGLIAGVLEAPLGELVGVAFPFVGLAGKLLNFVLKTSKKEPTLVQSISIVAQVAYLSCVKKAWERLEKEAEALPEPQKAAFRIIINGLLQ